MHDAPPSLGGKRACHRRIIQAGPWVRHDFVSPFVSQVPYRPVRCHNADSSKLDENTGHVLEHLDGELSALAIAQNTGQAFIAVGETPDGKYEMDKHPSMQEGRRLASPFSSRVSDR